MTGTTTFAPVLAEHIAAVNAFDEDAIVATFAEDAMVNDVHREFWGREAIRRWAARELVGDRVTIEVTEILDHHGDTIVRGRYDGSYDKTNLPDELVLTNYFTVRDGKIVISSSSGTPPSATESPRTCQPSRQIRSETPVVADGHAGAAARWAAGAVAGNARGGAGGPAGRGSGAPAEADQPRGPVPVALEWLKEFQHLLVG